MYTGDERLEGTIVWLCRCDVTLVISKISKRGGGINSIAIKP